MSLFLTILLIAPFMAGFMDFLLHDVPAIIRRRRKPGGGNG